MRSRTVPWGLALMSHEKIGKLGFTTQIWPGAQIDPSSRFSLIRLITIETILGKERHEKRWRKVGWGWESLITLGPKWKYDDPILQCNDGKRKTRDGEAGFLLGQGKVRNPISGWCIFSHRDFGRIFSAHRSQWVQDGSFPRGTPKKCTAMCCEHWRTSEKKITLHIPWPFHVYIHIYKIIQTYTSTYMRINYMCDTWHLHLHSHVHNYMYIMCLHKHLRYVTFHISFKACILKKS